MYRVAQKIASHSNQGDFTWRFRKDQVNENSEISVPSCSLPTLFHWDFDPFAGLGVFATPSNKGMPSEQWKKVRPVPFFTNFASIPVMRMATDLWCRLNRKHSQEAGAHLCCHGLCGKVDGAKRGSGSAIRMAQRRLNRWASRIRPRSPATKARGSL